MGVHLLSGNARDVPFFISESDYPGIERWIFTTGLALTGVVLCILSYRFRNMFDASEHITKLRISHTSGMTTGISLVVLAFANMYDYLVLHCIASIFVFGGGLVWGGFNPFTLRYFKESSHNTSTCWTHPGVVWLCWDEPHYHVVHRV